MQITDLGKKNNVTVPHPDCQVSPFPSLWSPVHLSSWAFGLTLPRLVLHLLSLLGFGFLDFFFFWDQNYTFPLFFWVTKAPLKIYSEPRHSRDNTL